MIKYIYFVTQRFRIVIARAEVYPIYKTWRVVSNRSSHVNSPHIPTTVEEVFDTYEEAEQFAVSKFQSIKDRSIKKIDEDVLRLRKRRGNIEAFPIKIRKMYLVK